jgi:phage-related protein
MRVRRLNSLLQTYVLGGRRLQNGELPTCDTRSMPAIGKGVWELKESDERAWYRVLYLSKVRDVIYVLHCFEKESRKTDKRDIATARSRLKQVLQRIREGDEK